MEDLIFRYLDGECTVSEIEEVERLIASDYSFAELFSELEMANDFMNAVPLETAPKGFSNRVMNQLLPKTKQVLNDYFIAKILVAFTLILSFSYAFENLPESLIQVDFSISDWMSPTTLIYTLLLLLFFLGIEFYLTKKKSITE